MISCTVSGAWQPLNDTCESQILPDSNQYLLGSVSREAASRSLKPDNPLAEFISPFSAEGSVKKLNIIDSSSSEKSYVNSAANENSQGGRVTALVTALVVTLTLLLTSVSLLCLFIAKQRKKQLANPASLEKTDSEKKRATDKLTDRSYDNKAFSRSIDSINIANGSKESTRSHRDSGDIKLAKTHFVSPRSKKDFVIGTMMKVSKITSSKNDNSGNKSRKSVKNVQKQTEPPYETVTKGDSSKTLTAEDFDDDDILNEQLYHVIHEHRRLSVERSLPESGSKISFDHGYETVNRAGSDKLEPGYETLSEKTDSGYEKIKGLDHQYETLMQRQEGINEHCYDTLKNAGGNDNEMDAAEPVYYEDSLTPETDRSDRSFKEESIVPDILKGTESSIEIPDSRPSSVGRSTVSPEILAMYAQVDKSKKKRTKPKPPKTTSKSRKFYVENGMDEDLSGYEKLPACFEVNSANNSAKPTPPPRPKNLTPLPSIEPTSDFNPDAYSFIDPDYSPNSSFKSARTNATDATPHRYDTLSSDSALSTRSSEFFDTNSLRPLPPIPDYDS